MLLVALATGCTGGSTGSEPTSDTGTIQGTVLVAAAASLTDAFAALAERFETDHPGVDVELSVGASSSLALSIEEGSPFDVFASANEAVMAGLDDAELLDGSPVEFATNTLVVAVPAGTTTVTSLDDFTRDDLLLGACAVQVPCGSYADELFAAADITPALDTRESDVRSLVTKLIEGELDAAIVYRTDVAAFPDALDSVALPAGLTVDARYPIAVLTSSPNPEGARAFVEFVTGEVARGELEQAGFGSP